MIIKERVYHALGATALALLIVGAVMYSLRLGGDTTVRVVFAAGGVLLILYALLNLSAIRAFFGRRTGRMGTNAVVMVVLFAAVVVIVQALSVRHSHRYDLTRNKRFSLAEQSVNIVSALDRPVTITGFYGQGMDDGLAAGDLFSQYRHIQPLITYELVDPDRDPQRAKEFDITDSGAIVIQIDDRHETIYEASEETVSNAMLRLSKAQKKLICFVFGHGEKDPTNNKADGFSIMAESLESENYEIRMVSLLQEEEIPDECAVLIVAGPATDYFDLEIARIMGHVSKGRHAIFMMDPHPPMPNLESFLQAYRALLEQDIIIDPNSRVFGGTYTVPVVTQYVEHAITRPLDQATFFPMARSVNISAEDVPGVTCQYLAIVGNSAWGETDLEGVREGSAQKDDNDIDAPIAVALIAAKKFDSGVPVARGEDESKLVLFGDSDFADNSSFRVSGNSELILNSINYLAEEKDLIAIRAKATLGDQIFLTAAQGHFILLIVVALPLGIAAIGTTILMRRRRQ